MKQHKYIRLLGLILALGFVLSACGDKTASSMSEGDSTSATTQPQEDGSCRGTPDHPVSSGTDGVWL